MSGKAFKVYSRIPSDEAKNYKKLKVALLQRYNLTEDGFRDKLRNSRIKPGETYVQFGERLRGYLNRWVETANLQKNFDDLSDLIIREQIVSHCGRDMSIFLKERQP
ncbi:hypothetical protein HOLleu_15410 [Holothuria leucospilota]|uniref:SCAN box domain-containing protein n=1 Tax=Holothuria leucospilota TaxID=206669 RepID=A0A9Q1HCF4_HOLLE|nr:hypothetical protein HOLleu_15410 [Holothuria leucospilota]